MPMRRRLLDPRSREDDICGWLRTRHTFSFPRAVPLRVIILASSPSHEAKGWRAPGECRAGSPRKGGAHRAPAAAIFWPRAFALRMPGGTDQDGGATLIRPDDTAPGFMGHGADPAPLRW